MNKFKFILAAIALTSVTTASMALAEVSPLHNPINGLDVDANTKIQARDALAIISVLLQPKADMSATALAEVTGSNVMYLDTSNDNRVNARDALLVISYLVAPVPEPSTLALGLLGLPVLVGYVWLRRRRNTA